MSQIIRTDSSNQDFVQLVLRLDQYLAIVDGDEHDFYDQFNKIDSLKHVVILQVDGQAVSCGAIKEYDNNTVEIKRMFTIEEGRGFGSASYVFNELEIWAKELNYKRCILETGKRQEDAIRLYHKRAYLQIPNYGQYAGLDNSICFEKQLIAK